METNSQQQVSDKQSWFTVTGSRRKRISPRVSEAESILDNQTYTFLAVSIFRLMFAAKSCRIADLLEVETYYVTFYSYIKIMETLTSLFCK